VLTGLGLLSFLLQRQALREWRLLVWLPFALLAAWHARAIPFFAVVAAPITALNWQDFFRSWLKRRAARMQVRPSLGAPSGHFHGRQMLLRAACLPLLFALLALLFLTWPGWLAGSGDESRHVAWGLEVEPSLKRAAETLRDWRQQGLLLPGERVFAVSPEVAQYSAWFSPGERQFFDHRLRLFAGGTQDYETVCRALLPGVFPPPVTGRGAPGTPAQDWRRVLREHAVGIVVFHDRDPQRLFAVLGRLAAERREWTLLHVSGQALIAGWNAGRPPGAFAALAFDPERVAFGPQDARAEQELPAAPERGPERLPPRRDFWARLAGSPPLPSWESAAATMYLHFFHDSLAWQDEQQRQSSMSAFAVSLAGLPALASAVPQAALQLVASRDVLFPRADNTFLVRDRLGPFFAHIVDRSPALPLLAVRAARRAVADNPEDSNAWLRLGQAYLLLRSSTCERSGAGLLPPLAYLRYVQIVTVLEQAVRLDPDLEAAHHELAYLYGERNHLDQSLEHRREEVRLSRRAGRRVSESAEEFADRLQLLDRDTALLEYQVQKRRQTYAAGFRTLQGHRLAEAGMALKLGLVRKAVDEILLPAPADLLGAAGIKLEVEALQSLGRAEEVHTILGDEGLRTRKQALLFHDLAAPKGADGKALYAIPYHWLAYDWLQLLHTAAVGDYAEVRAAVRAIRLGLDAGHNRLKQQLRDFEPRVVRLLPGLLPGAPSLLTAFTAQTLSRLHEETSLLRSGEPSLRSQQADLFVLEGLLALEQGDTQAARSAFTESRKMCAQPAGSATWFAGAPIAAAYLRKLNGYE
jgi:hypothetical protein